MTDTLPEPTSGPELADRRERLGIMQKDVASRLGVSRMTVHIWERSAKVNPAKAERYRLAIAAIMAERNEEAVS